MAAPVPDRPGLMYVAWHRGGAQTLRVGRRHLATRAAVEGRAVRQTLCGRVWRRSREVVPDAYWTTGDCATCVQRAAGQQ